MCNPLCINFVETSLASSDVRGKKVLEVGAFDVNGSPRAVIEALGPAEYCGVDIAPGPGVDEICDAEDLLKRFGTEAFDVVVSTEMIEHVANWQLVIKNFKQVLAPGGILIVTTRSKGFPLHDYPADYWRFEVSDMAVIFGDFERVVIENDPNEPGVFVRGRKPSELREFDLEGYALHSMISGCRSISVESATSERDSHHQRENLEKELLENSQLLEAYQNLRILRYTAKLRQLFVKSSAQS